MESLAAPQELQTGLQKLKSEAEAIVVTNQTQYIEAAQIENAAKSYIKDVKAKLGPGIESAKDHLNELKNQMAVYITPAERILITIQQKRISFAEQEKLAARMEQEKINAENRKKAEEAAEAERLAERKRIDAQKRAGDVGKREAERLKAEADEKAKKAAENAPVVSVKPSVPTVAGIKNQTFYFGEVTNPAVIMATYNQALIQGNLERQRFLAQFITVNEQAVGKFARDTKDNDKAASLVPGVRFYSKG